MIHWQRGTWLVIWLTNCHWGIPDLHLTLSTLTEVYSTCALPVQLTLRCSWPVPEMINSHWDVSEMYLKISTHSYIYLTYTLNDQISLRCTWLVPLTDELSLRCTWLVSLLFIWLGGVLDLYFIWWTLTEIYLNYTSNDQYSLRCIWFLT